MASLEEKIADVAAEDLLNPTVCGYLDKKRPSKNFLPEKYQKRWCVIYNRTFYYYERPTDRKQKGAFSLKGYRVKPSGTDEISFALICEGKDRSFYFRAQSVDEVSLWQTSVFKASRGDKYRSDNIYDSPPPQRHVIKTEPKNIRSLDKDKNTSASIDMGIYGSFDKNKKSNNAIYGSFRRKVAPIRHESLPEQDPETGPETPRDRSSSEPIIPEFDRKALLSSIDSQTSTPLYSLIVKPNKKKMDSTIGSSPPMKGNGRPQSPQLTSGYRASDTPNVPRRPLPQLPVTENSTVQQVASTNVRQPLETRTESPNILLKKKPLPALPIRQNTETVATSKNTTTTNYNTLPRTSKAARSPYNDQRPSIRRNVKQEKVNEESSEIIFRTSNRKKYSNDNDSKDLYYLSDSDSSDYEAVDTFDSTSKYASDDEPVYDRPGSYRISVNDSDVDQEGYLTKMSNKVPSIKARERVKKNYSMPNLESFSDRSKGSRRLQKQQKKIDDPPINFFPLDEYGYVIFVPLEEPDINPDENEDDYDTVTRLSSISTCSNDYSSVADTEMIRAGLQGRVEEVETVSDVKIPNPLTDNEDFHDYVNVMKFRKREDNKQENTGQTQREKIPTGKEGMHSLIKNELQKVLHSPVTKQYSEASYLNRRKKLQDQNGNNSGRINKSNLLKYQRNVQSVAPETPGWKGSSECTSESDSDYESVP